MSSLGSLELAVVLGMRHALDADHVAAVGTLIEPNARLRGVTGVAARWALGHASTLLIVGLALIVMGIKLPAHFETAAEVMVASALIGLGVRRLWVRGDHAHTLARGAFAVGVLHGLAGSGPMVLLAVSTVDQKAHALLYLVLVSVGTLLGMVGMAGLFSLPLARAAGRSTVRRAIELVAGVASIAAGLRLVVGLIS
jgi:nickel/cobalt transporter (NicO) family protein